MAERRNGQGSSRDGFNAQTYMDLDIPIATLVEEDALGKGITAFEISHGQLLERSSLLKNNRLNLPRFAALVAAYVRYYCRVPACRCDECRALPKEGSSEDIRGGHLHLRRLGPSGLWFALQERFPDEATPRALLAGLEHAARFRLIQPEHIEWFVEGWALQDRLNTGWALVSRLLDGPGDKGS